MSHENLANHYRINFSLSKHHAYSLTEINDMYPYERDMYVQMIIEYLEELKEHQRLLNRG